jgi:hypothetical protein
VSAIPVWAPVPKEKRHRTDLGTKVKCDATLIRVEADNGLTGIGAAPPSCVAVEESGRRLARAVLEIMRPPPSFHHGTVGILIFLRDNAATDPVEPAASAQHRSNADRDVASIRMASATLTGFAPAGCNLPDEHNARWAATRPFDHSVYRARNVLPWRPKAEDKGADTRELTDLGSCCIRNHGDLLGVLLDLVGEAPSRPRQAGSSKDQARSQHSGRVGSLR